MKVPQTSLSTLVNPVGKNVKRQEAKITMKNPTWNQQAHLPLVDLPIGFQASSYFPPGFHRLHHNLPPVTTKGMGIYSLGRCAHSTFHWLAQSITILLSPLSGSQAIVETSGYVISGFLK